MCHRIKTGMHDFIIHTKDKNLVKMAFKKAFKFYASLAIDMANFTLRRSIILGLQSRRAYDSNTMQSQ